MEGRHSMRRLILRVLVVAVGAATGLGSGYEARATWDDGAVKEDNRGSKANFQSYCTTMEGSFSQDRLGNTTCTYADHRMHAVPAPLSALDRPDTRPPLPDAPRP